MRRLAKNRASPLPRRVIEMFILSALVLTLGGCQDQAVAPPRPLEKVTVACAALTQAALVHVAHVNGYFAEEGLKVTLRKYTHGKAAMEALVEGNADFATAAETPIMFAIMQGAKISVIATIQTSAKNEAIVARKDRGILRQTDLKGRKVGVTLGTNGDFMLGLQLTLNGLSDKDINRIDLKPEEIPAALLDGRVDAAAIWNPYVIQLMTALGDKGVVFYTGDVYWETFNIVASRNIIQKNPGAVKRVLRAIFKADAFVRDDPGNARRLVAEAIGIDNQLMEEIWSLNDFSVSLTQALIIALEDESRWAIKSGLTGEKKVPNYLDYLYLDGLAAVKPESVRIIR